MFSKSQIKFITSLGQKKYRQHHGMFVVEGLKSIQEFIHAGYTLFKLYEVESYFPEISKSLKETIRVDQLKKISALKTPQKALAVFYIQDIDFNKNKGLKVVLDDIRDPGNLGTLVRLCDWFGVVQLICSPQTVDCYNSKVVQATMGSLARVPIIYSPLETFFKDNDLPVYGAFMDGDNVYGESLSDNAVLVLGNEANGVSQEVEKFVTQRIAIPQFGIKSTESLNVATAGAILMSEIKRKSY